MAASTSTNSEVKLCPTFLKEASGTCKWVYGVHI